MVIRWTMNRSHGLEIGFGLLDFLVAFGSCTLFGSRDFDTWLGLLELLCGDLSGQEAVLKKKFK